MILILRMDSVIGNRRLSVSCQQAGTVQLPFVEDETPGGPLSLMSKPTFGAEGRRRKILSHVSSAAVVAGAPLSPRAAREEDGATETTRSGALGNTLKSCDNKITDEHVIAVRSTLQPKVYLEGMQFMDSCIQEIIDELNHTRCQFYHTTDLSEENIIKQLKACDGHFLQANIFLRKHSVHLEVIDSETRLVSLLNQLRDNAKSDNNQTIQFLTGFWQDLMQTNERLKGVVIKFETNVLLRLKQSYISYDAEESEVDVCSSYSWDISSCLAKIDKFLSNTHILLKSISSGIHQNLFEKHSWADLIVINCDVKAFPVLLFVDDVVLKVMCMCDLAWGWLDRDQLFMQDIQHFIREARHRTRKREEDLKCQKEKQKRHERSLKAASILLQSKREKLRKIEAELAVLEGQMNASERDRQWRCQQLHQKETIVDFLLITLSQTKHNYTMQNKRSRLSKQVKDLQELLLSMEQDLDCIQGKILIKAEEKLRLSEKVVDGEKSYKVLRNDMDKFGQTLQQLESEVTDLSSKLLQLELIHNMKTSPEKVEEIYDRPSTVKLAPSLKEKLKEHKKKLRGGVGERC